MPTRPGNSGQLWATAMADTLTAANPTNLVRLGRFVGSGGQVVIPFPVNIVPGQGAVGFEGFHVLGM